MAHQKKEDPEDNIVYITPDTPSDSQVLYPDSPDYDPALDNFLHTMASDKSQLEMLQDIMAKALIVQEDQELRKKAIRETINAEVVPLANGKENDPETLRAAIEKAGGAEAIREKAQKRLQSYDKATAELAKEAITTISAFVNSDTYKTIREGIATLATLLVEHKDDFARLAEAAQEMGELAPFIEEEMKGRPEFENCTLDELIEQGFDEDGNLIDSPFKEVYERAKKRKAEVDATENLLAEAEQTAEALPKISYKKSKQVKTVTDRLMNVFFSITAPTGENTLNGQRSMIPVKYEGNKSKKEITLYYDFEYNEDVLSSRGIPKGFGSFEYFVETTLDNLKENGNVIVSFTKILEEMGIEAASYNIEKLANVLTKGATTTIYIDDLEVQRAWGHTDKYHEIVGQVFPITLINERHIANGNITDGAVKINDYSPFRILAGSLDRLTRWDKNILRLYTGRKTDRYWNVMQILIREIGWMRNKKSKRSRKILYSTLYAHNGDKTTRAKQLTRDMLYRLLDEVFIPTGYVTRYREDNGTTPGVTLATAEPPQLTAQ